MEENIDIQRTIFEPYETVIFDLDGVLWDCFQPNGQSTGVYTAVPPFKREAGNIVTASNGAVIRLQEGVEQLLAALDKANKNLGIVSRSEAQGVTFAAQPAVMLLKQYGIYKYFNYDVIIKWGINKAEYVKPNGKTLFIDDDQQNLGEVQQKDQVDVLWRKSFVNWNQTLSPVQSSLHLSFMKLGWEVGSELIKVGDHVQVRAASGQLRRMGIPAVFAGLTGYVTHVSGQIWIDFGRDYGIQVFPLSSWQKYLTRTEDEENKISSLNLIQE
jgi:predicted phosphatase